MQTFLPLSDFKETAKVLDYRRLGKQRVECFQILTALTENKGWIHHPATKMWKGSEGLLACYGIEICAEWINRGYKDNMMARIRPFCDLSQKQPHWLGDEAFHSSHRQTLLFKNIEWYCQFGWKELPKYEHIWPKCY